MSAYQSANLTLLRPVARTASGTALVSAEVAAGLGLASYAPVLGRFRRATLLLDASAVATDVSDTLNVYIQKNVGTKATPIWTDFVSFAQILGNGGAQQFVAEITADGVVDADHHVLSDGALTPASTNQGPWSNDWRVKWVAVDGGGANASFTFSLQGQFDQ